MREYIKFLALLGFLWVIVAPTVVERCLDGDKLSFIFDGTPSPTTPLLLRTLKKLNITAMFAIDFHKLAVGGSAQIIKNILDDGHVVGLSISDSTSLNTMSDEGLRGTLEKASDDIDELVGKKPLLVRVSRTASRERVALLEGMGYLVIQPDLDLSSSRPGQCCQELEARLNEKSHPSSPIISIGDTDTGCSAEEMSKMISSIKSHQSTLTRIDSCIGLEKPYKSAQKNPNDETLPNLPDPIARRPVSTVIQGSALKNSASGVSLQYWRLLSLAFLLYVIIN